MADAYALFSSQPAQVDGFELRLDRFAPFDISQIEELIVQAPAPLLFTLRKKSQGGSFAGAENARLALIEQLLALRPAYFDLEHDTPRAFLAKLIETHLYTKFILSYHNFHETPPLESVLQDMRAPSIFAYKIACQAESELDALRMSAFVQKSQKLDEKLIGVCMGKAGASSRILGKLSGNFLNYAALNTENALEGQLTLDALQQIYRFRHLSQSTNLFALIGDPVDGSPSHLTHNHLFGKRPDLDSVYLKIPVKAEELAAFFKLARTLAFRGLSVTMPYKEAILPLLNELAPEARLIGAVNTVVFKDEKLFGHNTDGLGALDALEERGSVTDKRIVILGAGGTARALAYESRKRGAHVVLINRTKARAEKAAAELSCEGYGFQGLERVFKDKYDILINATPSSILEEKWIQPQSIAMDVVSTPRMTPFLRAAEQKGCTLVFGSELFLHQAVYQFGLWFGSKLKVAFIKETLQEKLKETT